MITDSSYLADFFLFNMFQPKFYTGEYIDRQRAANKDKAIVYVEQHFNSPGANSNYALANVATNGGATSKAIARAYVERICRTFGTSKANNDFAKDGVSIGGYQQRGNKNLFSTNMPAVLLEPLFASNPKHAEIIRSEDGQRKLATCLVETIKEFFPHGGIVAFSVGHKGKPSKPRDRGVELSGGGAEADYAEKVLKIAAEMLGKS